MRCLKIPNILFFSGIIFFASCKKNDSISNPTTGDNCVIKSSAIAGNIIEGQYIVVYKKSEESLPASTMPGVSRSVLRNNNISETALQASFPGEPGGFVAKLNHDEVDRLSKDDAIEAIENDRIVKLSTCFQVVAPTLITWNVNKVGYGDGTGKTAWIIDSGIDFNHPDLNVDTTRSRSFMGGLTSPSDENGHGTHVAGIIGAKNNEIGVLGIASNANLVSLRVLDKDGEGTLSGIVQAVAHVATFGKPGDVVNLSIGGEEPSSILDQQVENTAAKGIFIAIAAGNESKTASSFSPGRANGPNIYTVSAVDSLDNFASFSNYGNDVVDFAAPGVRILSTYIGGRYAWMSGTSMAAPHVAGLLLLDGRNIRRQGVSINDPDGNPDPIAHK